MCSVQLQCTSCLKYTSMQIRFAVHIKCKSCFQITRYANHVFNTAAMMILCSVEYQCKSFVLYRSHANHVSHTDSMQSVFPTTQCISRVQYAWNANHDFNTFDAIHVFKSKPMQLVFSIQFQSWSIAEWNYNAEHVFNLNSMQLQRACKFYANAIQHRLGSAQLNSTQRN